MIDLVYCEDEKGNKEICVAPYHSCHEGDRVITEFGITKVVEIVSTYDGDDIYDFFKEHTTIRPVQAVIKDLENPYADS